MVLCPVKKQHTNTNKIISEKLALKRTAATQRCTILMAVSLLLIQGNKIDYIAEHLIRSKEFALVKTFPSLEILRLKQSLHLQQDGVNINRAQAASWSPAFSEFQILLTSFKHTVIRDTSYRSTKKNR